MYQIGIDIGGTNVKIGLLNEALPGKNLPEDVSGLVAELGFNVDNNAEDIVNVIAKHAGKEA